MMKHDFKGSYPSRPFAFYIGRIILQRFREEVGMELMGDFKILLGDDGTIVFKHEKGDFFFTLNCLKEFLILNMRLGTIPPDEGVLMKWIRENKPELVEED